ncbi:MAG: hypothetical protein ACRC8S_05010 [Fimbriiglobus sp.]
MVHFKRWLLFAIIGLLLIFGYDRVTRIRAMSKANLEMEFRVHYEGWSGSKPKTHIEIQSFEEDPVRKWSVPAEDGVAFEQCDNVWMGINRSGLGFTEEFAPTAPLWKFRVVAEGFAPTEWELLDPSESRRRPEYVGGGQAKMLIPVTLTQK